jgi:hypothetical protein
MNSFDFVLLPWQQKVEKALRDGATHIYLKAGRKSGKTEYLRYRILEWMKDKPIVADQINAYIAPYRSQAKNIFWRRIKSSLDRKYLEKKPGETELTLDITTGVRQQLFGADHEEALRGLLFGPSVLDEADFMRQGVYEEIIEPNMSVTMAPVIMSSTPKNGWFTRRWREAKDGLLGKSHVAFHFTIYDNPYISKSIIEKIRRSIPTDMWEQEYLANENAYTGLMYPEFANVHVCKHKEPSTHGKFARSLDWGFDHPSHCLWAEIYKNNQTGRWNLYIYREFTTKGKDVEGVVKPIVASDSRPFLFSIIDISALRREMGTGTSIISEFRRHGYLCRVSLKDDACNINATKMMLKNCDIRISEKCTTLIRQMRAVEWGQKEGDDAADALKYLCGMVYNRDFANIESGEIVDDNVKRLYESQNIDPTGIMAAPSRLEDAMEWAPY